MGTAALLRRWRHGAARGPAAMTFTPFVASMRSCTLWAASCMALELFRMRRCVSSPYKIAYMRVAYSATPCTHEASGAAEILHAAALRRIRSIPCRELAGLYSTSSSASPFLSACFGSFRGALRNQKTARNPETCRNSCHWLVCHFSDLCFA
jgi:hypothetical protein